MESRTVTSASSTSRATLEWTIENARSLASFPVGTRKISSAPLSFKDFGIGHDTPKFILELLPNDKYPGKKKKKSDPDCVGVYLAVQNLLPNTELKVVWSVKVLIPSTKAWETVIPRTENLFKSEMRNHVGAPSHSWGDGSALRHDDLFKDTSKYLSEDGMLTLRAKVKFGNGSDCGHGVQRSNLADDLSHLLKSAEGSDLVLTSSDQKKFPAHSLILAARSNVFENILESGSRDKKSRNVRLKDVDSYTLDLLLRYVYTGATPGIPENAEQLLAAADRLEISDLRELALQHVIKSLTMDNAFRLLEKAQSLDLTDLKDSVSQYIAANLDAFAGSKEAKQFKKDNAAWLSTLEGLGRGQKRTAAGSD